ncbi:LEO1-like protein [Drosera capensis]
MKEEKRHQMMQNLFGDQSEDEEEEEEEEDEVEIDSEHESNRHPNYLSDEAEGMEHDGEGEAFAEGQDEAAVESEGELNDGEQEQVDSDDGEREQIPQEVEVRDQEESEGRETDSEEGGGYAQRVVTSRRRDIVDSASEQSLQHYDHEDDEVTQRRSPGSEEEDKDQVPEIRDVFGESDEEPADYAAPNDMDDEHKSPVEDEDSYEKGLRHEDVVRDGDAQYEFDQESSGAKHKEKPAGPSLELEIPLRPPPAKSEKMNIIRVSNIMGIDPIPFDPKTYIEEDDFVTDESGAKKRIRLENNIVRWRTMKKADGTVSRESNARFVRWSDNSLQLLIGNEVLDISVQDAQHDHAYLFLRHGKGILQSQGRLLKKMRFMPSSLSSNSHRLLTAIVDSRHKKVYKVKNCITDVDPEKEKERKEKAEGQTIRANVILNRKRERVNRKYSKPVGRGRELSPGFLEDPDEEDEQSNYYDSRRQGSRRGYDEDFEAEARAEKRIIDAKKGRGFRDVPQKSSFSASKASRRPIDFSDSERDKSEYETDGEEEERSPPRHIEDSEPEYVDSEEEEQEVDEDVASEEDEEPAQKVQASKGSLKRKEIESDEDSAPAKPTMPHRRKAVVFDSDED